jgi:hypothetical protein
MMSLVKHGPGRPKKYGRPSRALTVTLPEDIITRLQAIDADLGRAIVAIADSRTPRGARTIRPAELSSYGNSAVIVVMPFKALKRIPDVKLVPIGSGRALISLDRKRSVADFELEVRDALDRVGVASTDRRPLEMLAQILRDARRSEDVTVRERTIIVLESKRRRRAG